MPRTVKLHRWTSACRCIGRLRCRFPTTRPSTTGNFWPSCQGGECSRRRPERLSVTCVGRCPSLGSRRKMVLRSSASSTCASTSASRAISASPSVSTTFPSEGRRPRDLAAPLPSLPLLDLNWGWVGDYRRGRPLRWVSFHPNQPHPTLRVTWMGDLWHGGHGSPQSCGLLVSICILFPAKTSHTITCTSLALGEEETHAIEETHSAVS